jgi:hypothetical protein
MEGLIYYLGFILILLGVLSTIARVLGWVFRYEREDWWQGHRALKALVDILIFSAALLGAAYILDFLFN